MSDPAIEAAERARRARTPRSEWRNAMCSNPREIAAAREALKPVQEWFARWNPSYGHDCWYDDPRKCAWPGHRKLDPLPHEAWEELGRSIFTTEELER